MHSHNSHLQRRLISFEVSFSCNHLLSLSSYVGHAEKKININFYGISSSISSSSKKKIREREIYVTLLLLRIAQKKVKSLPRDEKGEPKSIKQYQLILELEIPGKFFYTQFFKPEYSFFFILIL